MALPTPLEQATLDYAYMGSPFVYVPSKSSITSQTMDYGYLGDPFVVTDYVAAAATTARSFAFIMG